jgi:membrane protein
LIELLKETYAEWSRDNCMRLGASLAYYTIFSLAPMLVIVIAVAGFAFGERAAEGEIVEQLRGLLGPEGAAGVQAMIKNAGQAEAGVVATVVGVGMLLLGATTVFTELHAALNDIWNVPKSDSWTWWDLVRARVSGFTIILGIGFLLLVSLVVSAVLSALHGRIAGLFPGAPLLFQGLNFLVSFGVVTLLFAMIFKLLPDATIGWGDVWVGAAFTSLLFGVGKVAIGYYLGVAGAGSVYGAAGSLVIVLLWVFYSSQLLFFGAEFTQVWARRRGSLAAGASQGG